MNNFQPSYSTGIQLIWFALIFIMLGILAIAMNNHVEDCELIEIDNKRTTQKIYDCTESEHKYEPSYRRR